MAEELKRWVNNRCEVEDGEKKRAYETMKGLLEGSVISEELTRKIDSLYTPEFEPNYPQKEISEVAEEKYNLVHDKLLGRYDFEKRKGTVMTSIFWLTCIEELYDSIKMKDISDLDYNKAVEYLSDVGETMVMKMKKTGYEYDLKNIHGPEDINHIKEMNKKGIEELFEFYKDKDEDLFERKVENIKWALNKWKGVSQMRTNDIKLIFIYPLIEEMDNCKDKECKLVTGSIGNALYKYLEEYRRYY